MTLPGVEVLQADERSATTGPRLQLSTVFVLGETERGPETPDPLRPLRSPRELTRTYGARTAESQPVWDWLDAHWKDGGGRVYLAPVLGPAAAYADIDLSDGSTTALTVTARDKGDYGDRLGVDVDVSGSNFELKIYLDGTLVERSGMVADGAAAAAWSTGSRYVTVTDGPGGDPVATVSAQALTGGDSDLDGVTVNEIVAAYQRLDPALGPGVVVLPGRTASGTITAIADAAAGHNRLVRADFPPVSDRASVVAWLTALRSGTDHDDIIDAVGPALTVPGIGGSGSRTVGASFARSAAESRNDANGTSPNQTAAGRWGISSYATGVTVEWGAEDREAIVDAGGNIVRIIDNDIRVYGMRTLADPADNPAGVSLGSARLRMAIAEIGRFEGEQINFAEFDQGGVALGEHVGAVRSGISRYAGSLYFLDVTAELEEDEDQPGLYLVETDIEFQAAPGAERVRVTITRQVTEV